MRITLTVNGRANEVDVEPRDLEVDGVVADHELVPERYGGEGHHDREHREEGCQEVQELVGPRRHHVLFREELDGVGHGAS